MGMLLQWTLHVVDRVVPRTRFAAFWLLCFGCFLTTRSADSQGPFFGGGQPDSVAVAWNEARQLESEDKTQAAFLKYLSLSGGETAAVKLGRPHAKEFLSLLHDQAPAVPVARRRLVEGDLLLALRDKAGALVAYQDVAAKIATTSQQGWEQGVLPRDEYFVEPPAQQHQRGGRNPAGSFTVGPGSHRDNWLIRRFIALEAWGDARREFERVWQLHREAIQPYVVQLPTYDDKGQQTGTNRHVVRPAGFSGLGLQFALDYAFFLQRRDAVNTARDVLMEALLQIDMDRNPNRLDFGSPVTDTEGRGLPDRFVQVSRRRWGRGRGYGTSGISRTEFIRLTYGTLKTSGHEAELVQQITDRIAAGQNQLRRVLAQIRLQQGQPDQARESELEFTAASEFDPVSAAFRRATVFDGSMKPQDAVREFETVLALLQRDEARPPKWNLPDALEADGIGRGMAQQSIPVAYGNQNGNLRTTTLMQLERLYTALGQTDQSLDVARQLVLQKPSSSYYRSFENLSRKHRVAQQSEKLLEWAAQQLDAAKDENVRANLHWLLGDRRAAAASIAKSPTRHELPQWKERFRTAGNEHFRELLKAVVAANPKDAQSQLELLELDGVTDGPQLVVRLELLLESDSQWAFGRGKGGRNQTRFKDRFELAYRLIRIYERAGQFDKLHALSLRIARSQKPFELASFSQFQYRSSNGVPERANAALAVAIQHADTAEKTASLKAALENSVWAGARAQLQRRVAKGNPKPAVEFVWANLPAGVQLVASTENVLALAHDDRYVYSGHPWGVAVHDLKGQPVIRIALGEAARSLVVMKQHLWVGSPKGLFRINRTDWSVAHQWLHEDVRENDRYGKSFPGTMDYWFDNSVYTLTADGDDLWIGLHRNVQRLNTRTLALRAWSFEELKITSWAGFSNIVVDDRYVWANSNHVGVRRYDRISDEWSAPRRVGPREPVRFVGIIEGRVFGNAWVNDQLRNRLCLIDRETLATQTIPVAVKKEQELINSPLRFYGKHGDRLVFGVDWPAFVLDEARLTLLPIAKVVENFSEQLRAQRAARNGDESLVGAIRAMDQLDAFRKTFGRPYSREWQVLTLPNGARVLGARQDHSRYEYPHEDSPRSVASAQHEVKESVGGLFFVKPDEAGIRRVSAEPRSSSIRGDTVRAIVFGTEHSWLCTSLGIAQFDLERGVERVFTRADGLCSNRVTGAAEASGKTYFSTSWGDSGGGLAVLDSTTSVFTTLMEEDGLPTGKVDRVRHAGRQLSLVFGTEYLRHNSSGNLRYRRFPPLAFDPEAHRFGPKVEPKLLTQKEARPREKARWSTVPFLAGALTQRVEHKGKVYLCGTRGLVISDREVSHPTFPEIGARLHITLTARHLADAETRKVMIQTPAELAIALRDENPFYRANAIASTSRIQQAAPAGFLPLMASQLNEKNTRLRATAFYFVTRNADDERVVPLLRDRLQDSDLQISALATLDLVRRGHVPEIKRLQEVIDANSGNYPFGARSSIGAVTGAKNLHRAIAPHATPEVFEWLLNAPPRLGEYDYRETVFPQLGASLRRHPKAIDILLKVRDATSYDQRQRDFARDVFRMAGPDVLPQLHAALKSDDRVVRSNAARACGAIKDASSIEPLVQAVDLESGLSRASIVWALGELKARAALPVLATLYAEARADEKRSNASGFRTSQAVAVVRSQYDRISNLESLAADWDDLKSASLNPPIDPVRQEELLRPRHILEAVAKIGPELSQEFYRALAASKDRDARQEAAEHLSAAPPSDRARNAVVLKSLLTDNVLPIRIRAAVGLLLFGDTNGQNVIVEALNSKQEWEQRQTLEQLARLRNPSQRSFALARIKVIAANRLLHNETRRAASNLLK